MHHFTGSKDMMSARANKAGRAGRAGQRAAGSLAEDGKSVSQHLLPSHTIEQGKRFLKIHSNEPGQQF